MAHEEMSTAYLEAIRRGFGCARELDQRCGPVHLLVGVAEGDGPAAAALHPAPGGVPLRAFVAAQNDQADRAGQDASDSRYGGIGHLHMQAQGAAMALAESRGEPVTAEHLLIALIDQGTAPVIGAITQAGLDPAAVRDTATRAIGAADIPRADLPPLTPAGTLDRAPLPVAELDPRAWAALGWRQDHLPIGKLRRSADRDALQHLERAEAWRLADRLGLDDDQRYSLIRHHESAVSRRIDHTRPDLPGPPSAHARAEARMRALSRRHRRRPRPVRALSNLTVGWAAWLRNRRTSLRDHWFRLRTTSSYRGAPQP